MQNVKLVVVGDAAVGKTSLLITYTSRQFPTDYIPLVFEGHAYDITVDERDAVVGLWDTVGNADAIRRSWTCIQRCIISKLLIT